MREMKAITAPDADHTTQLEHMFEQVQDNIAAKMADRFDEMEAEAQVRLHGRTDGRKAVKATEGDFLTKSDDVAGHPVFASGDKSEPVELGAVILAAANGKRDNLNAAERKALDSISGPNGGYLLNPVMAPLVDATRNQARVIQAGARTLPMAAGEVLIPKLDGSVEGAWKSENASVSDEAPTFSRNTLVAKTCAVFVKVSQELYEDGGPEAARIITGDMRLFRSEWGSGVAERVA